LACAPLATRDGGGAIFRSLSLTIIDDIGSSSSQGCNCSLRENRQHPAHP
jgi:hypothetical protein